MVKAPRIPMAALRSVLAAGVLAVLADAVLAAGPQVGRTLEVRGIAVAEADAVRRNLRPQAPLHLDETLTTGHGSRLTARLRDATLALSADARLVIDAYVAGSRASLLLRAGAVLVEAAPGAFRQRLTVTSPFGVIGVRGTRFFAGPVGETFGVFCAEGSVSVTAGGRTVLLAAGEGVDIARAGGPPGPVRQWGQAKIDRALASVR
jgi:ferric-dicitrate binding protein FerR (iron transport regulator)